MSLGEAEPIRSGIGIADQESATRNGLPDPFARTLIVSTSGHRFVSFRRGRSHHPRSRYQRLLRNGIKCVRTKKHLRVHNATEKKRNVHAKLIASIFEVPAKAYRDGTTYRKARAHTALYSFSGYADICQRDPFDQIRCKTRTQLRFVLLCFITKAAAFR